MPSPNASDSNFERTFADLAYARLRDKAPSMLDYLIGFQLIDKNEEETHAVGVFGFKVGSEWVYAPVFFINGELKGHELMYIKSQDAFVPMTEEWVNYVLNRRPSVLGETEQKDRNELPLRQPDFDVFARSPYIGSKFAGHIRPSFNQIVERIDPDFHGFMPVLHPENWPNGSKYARLRKRFTVPGALRTLGKRAMGNLVQSMRKDEKFANAVLGHYDLIDDIRDFHKAAEKDTKAEAGYKDDATYSKCRDCKHYVEGGSCTLVSGDISPEGTCDYWAATPVRTVEPLAGKKTASTDADKGPHTESKGKNKKPRAIPKDKAVTQEEQDELGREEDLLNELQPVIPLKNAALVITEDEAQRYDPYLSDEDKSNLCINRYLVKDARHDDAVSSVYSTQISTSIQGPRDSAVYDVLAKDGTSKEMLVLTTPLLFGVHTRRERGNMAVVVDLGTKSYGNYFPIDILTTQQHGGKRWNTLLASGRDPKTLKPGSTVVLIGPDQDGTCVFEVDGKRTNAEGQTEFNVYPLDSLSGNASILGRNRSFSDPGGEFSSSIRSVVLSGKDAPKMQQIGEVLYVPNAYKAIVIKEPQFDTDSSEDKPVSAAPASTLSLGNINDFWQQLYKESEDKDSPVRRLRILTDGISFQAELNGRQGPKLSKVATLKTLIMSYGLRKKDADHLIKSAQPRKPRTYIVKFAQGYGDVPAPAYFPEPTLGDEGGIPAPIMYPQHNLQNIGQIDPNNRQLYRDYEQIDEGAKRYAENAAAQGQKEVLDTAVISGLVRTMETDSAVDSYIGDLLLGLDRIGRILFMFYWHNEKFKDRYGQQDMPELEDNLRNVFKNLGELALFLKQKTIEPDEADSSEVELTDVLS